ncbi:hypothetical protein JVU11DRAFT_3920 [Chiua virens]|nr:hypothetical protein JVU11DRAFT_3920 [Chiua virens]
MVLFSLISVASVTSLLSTAVLAVSWTAQPLNPASIPLAVRSPYLSAWLPQGTGAAAESGVAPILGYGGWAGYIRVDKTMYTILGDPVVPGTSPTLATQQSMQFTATSTYFHLNAGPVDIFLNFTSPVEPSDLTKQSTPFSYLAIQAISTNGAAHSVSIYTDISAEWACASDNTRTVTWQSNTTGPVFTHQVMLQSEEDYTEYSDFILQGAAYYSTTNNGTSTTYQTGQDVVVRAQFIGNGVLANTLNTTFRAISDDWPVFAFAQDLGTVSGTSDVVVFTIGHVRDPAVEYIIAGGVYQARSLYALSNSHNLFYRQIEAFIEDFSNAILRSQEFDQKVESDASAISSNYAGVVQLSIRQAFGAMEITISQTADGSWNTSDVLMFLKEISSDGYNINTVDVIMPAWPVLLYTNPALGKYLLLSLFEYQATGQWPKKYAVHDLGSTYPKATGHNDGNAEDMPLEECGNMLIMTLSYTQKTADTSIITSYIDLLNQWTGYLVAESLIPAYQISTDDFAGALANQTNLAIKGVIGIQAMAEISGMLGDATNQQNYSSIVASYVPQILNLATAEGGKHLGLVLWK